MPDPRRAFAELRALPLFAHWTDDQLAGVAQLIQPVALEVGAVLFDKGEDGGDFLVVLAGAVEVARATPVGTQPVAHLGRGDLVGEVSFLDGKARDASVRAEAATELLRFPAAAVRHLELDDPGFAAALLRSCFQSLATKIRQANGFMNQIMTAPAASPGQAGAAGERIEVDPAAKLAVFREQGLSAEEVATLAGAMRAERFPPEAFLFREGESGDTVYVVAEGQVRISRHLHGMGEEALAILARGEVFGELNLMDAQPRSADARAHGAGCTVLSIDRSRLDRVLRDAPRAGLQFLTLLCRMQCKRLRAMNDLLVAWRTMAGFG